MTTHNMTQPDAWIHERFEALATSHRWADGSPVPDEPPFADELPVDEPVDEPVATVTDEPRRKAALRAVHATGRMLHPLAWDERRPTYCRAASNGRTASSAQLTPDELLAVLQMLNDGVDPSDDVRRMERDAQPLPDPRPLYIVDGAYYRKPRT